MNEYSEIMVSESDEDYADSFYDYSDIEREVVGNEYINGNWSSSK